MKVLALRADYGGCSLYRIVEPARVVQEQFDVEVKIDSDLDVSATQHGDGFVEVDGINEDVDLIVIQRPLNQSMHAVAVQAQKQGIAVIAELDDDFHSVHPRNPAYKQTQPDFAPMSNIDWLSKTIDLADWVTVSTPALTKYGAHGRVSVIRNCVPQRIFDIVPSPGSDRGIGWTGTVRTHPGDLEMTEGGVSRAVQKIGQSFKVVGDGLGVAEALNLPGIMSVQATGWKPLNEYYQTIADNISVGIVPLIDSPFNNAKSNLKGLEMAALGIPFVASPSDEYFRLAMQGAGQLATTSDEWYRRIYSLATNGRSRTTAANKYQKVIQEHYVYERNAHEWYSVWQQAIAHRKSL